MDALTAAVAAELRAYRAASRLTIDQLAETTGIGSRTLKRLLNAQRDIDVRVIDLLSTALEFDPEELMARARARAQRDGKRTA